METMIVLAEVDENQQPIGWIMFKIQSVSYFKGNSDRIFQIKFIDGSTKNVNITYIELSTKCMNLNILTLISPPEVPKPPSA